MNQELKRILTIIVSILSIALAVVALSIEWDQTWWIKWGVALYFIIVSNVLLVAYFKNYLKTYKLCITLQIVGYVVVAVYGLQLVLVADVATKECAVEIRGALVVVITAPVQVIDVEPES